MKNMKKNETCGEEESESKMLRNYAISGGAIDDLCNEIFHRKFLIPNKC